MSAARRLLRIVLTVCSVMAVAPLSVAAENSASKVARIGFLSVGGLGSPETRMTVEAFEHGLRDHGYVDGRNVRVEYRGADGNLDRLRSLATELARLKVDLIVAVATPAARAAQQVTTTIPIVAVAMGDPVGDGLVTSLARPGGNLTGTTFLGPALVPKHLELVKEALPRASLVAILWHPRAFAESTMRDMARETEAAARTLGLRLHFAPVGGPDELAPAFASLARERPDAVVIAPSALLFAERRRIVALARTHRLPSLFNSREAVELGGLFAYGTSLPALVRRSAAHVDKVLRGARPADLPVEQPTTFELVLNLETARALGLTIPASVLARADRVVQ